MIPALTCLLLPFAGDCQGVVRDVPRIADVERDRAHYSGKMLSVTGRVQRLDQWNSRSGLAEEVFFLCDGGCVRVYVPGHSPIHDGQRVTVRGTYYEAFHFGRATFYNELEATEVLSRE